MTKVSEVYISRIPQLPELLELPSTAYIPIYNAASDITGRISAILLKGGTENKQNWNPETSYLAGEIVEFQLKFWKSLIGTQETPNIGNTPIEGTYWTEVSRSTGNGYGYWSAGVFTQDPSMVIRSGGLFLLDNTKVTFPYYSTDFEAEYQQGIWVQLTGSGSGGGFVWDIQHIDSAVTTSFNAVKNTIYLIDATTAPVTGLLPNAVAENVDDYSFVLYKDTHKFTLTTVGGTQLINNATSQIIPTIGGSLNVKCNGTGFDVVSDTRQLTSIVNITANRDFTVDGFENNINYLITPNGGETTILFPPAFALPGNIAIKSRFEQVGPGRVSFGAVSGNIGSAASQVTNGDGQGFDIVWCNEEYSLQNDTRPKQLTASLASYPVSELSTITDPARGAFFNQRVSTVDDSRFNKITAVESSTVITANPTDPWQCFSSSISDEGVLIGDVAEGLINLIANARRTGVNVNVYFEYLKRSTAGVYTSISQSSVISINTDTTAQYLASATHALFSMVATDRIAVRGYARKSTTGSNPTLYFSAEGATPTRSTIEVSAGTIAHNTLAGRDLLGAHDASVITITPPVGYSAATVKEFADEISGEINGIVKSDTFNSGLTFDAYFKYYPKQTQSGDINFTSAAKTLPNSKINVELELNSIYKTRIDGVDLADVTTVPYNTTNFAILRNDYNGLSGLYDAIFYRIGASDLIRCEIIKVAKTQAAAPKITGYTFATDNSYVLISSNQPLYGNNTASLPVQANDFAIANTDLRGGLSSISIASITKENDSPLIGGETTLKINLTLAGTANGDEVFEIKPVINSVYSNFGVVMSDNETTGVLLINFDSVTPIINALSIVDSAHIAAITNFVTNLRSNFVWRDIFTLYPFYSNTAASQKWNWKNPLDTDAARRLTFVNDNVAHHTSSGYKGAGTGYINTHILSSDFGSNDVCFAYHAYEALDITFGSQNGTSYLAHSKNGTVNYIGFDSGLANTTKDYTNTNIINLREFDNVAYLFRGNQLMTKWYFEKGTKNTLELYLSSINKNDSAWLTRNVGISFWMTGINLTTTKNHVFNSKIKTLFSVIKPAVTFSPDYSGAVMFQGDSISTDYNIPANTGWTTLLANNKSWYKVSAAMSGRTLNNSQNNSLYRLKDLDIPRYSTEYLYSIIALGINDSIITTSVPVQSFIDQYNLTIDDYVSKGWDLSKLTLLTPYYKKNPDSRLLSFVQAVKDIGAARGIRVIDIYTYMLNNGGDTLIQADGIHPTEAGHTVIYNYVSAFYI